jgi:hypothetical protein
MAFMFRSTFKMKAGQQEQDRKKKRRYSRKKRVKKTSFYFRGSLTLFPPPSFAPCLPTQYPATPDEIPLAAPQRSPLSIETGRVL